ncbi:MAG TPA: SRPBCC domain-containing protein [Steroidobacteraceae bacterium]|nr:SRPBCC domain-containing protein [Steroidobacteraceae bacterium]
MAAETRGYAQRVDIRADIEVVWNALIEPATLAIWYAPGARVDAREGGLYSARHGENLQREAHIDVFLPPRRLRLIYMPFPDLPDEGAVVVEDFLLDRDPAAARAHNISAVTVLRLMGSGVPESDAWTATYVALRRGWERALLRLKVLLERAPDRGPEFTRLTGL